MAPSHTPSTPSSPETRVNTTLPQSPNDPGHVGKLPHERDQTPDATPAQPSPAMKQAYADLQKGLVDTDARGASGRPLGSKAPADGALPHPHKSESKPR